MVNVKAIGSGCFGWLPRVSTRVFPVGRSVIVPPAYQEPAEALRSEDLAPDSCGFKHVQTHFRLVSKGCRLRSCFEVSGGSELKPSLLPAYGLAPSLAPSLAAPVAPEAAPLDEDHYGRRLGRAPPAYEVGPPPAYDGPGVAEDWS